MILRDFFAEDETDLAWLLNFNWWSTITPRYLLIGNSRKEVDSKKIFMMLVVFAKIDDMAFVSIKSKEPHVSPSL